MPRVKPVLYLLMLMAAAAVFASGAAAEMPQNRDAPTITAVPGAVVGQVLLGNNGTWLYVDGSPCRDECRYSFAWQRCDAGGACVAIPDGGARAYRVAPADVGRSLRVAVTATKYDCNAHGVDCRNVARTAISAQTPTVAPTTAPARLAISRIAVERATRGRLLVSLRISDERGRPAPGARVTVRMARVVQAAVAGSSGDARVAVRPAAHASAVALSIRVERAGAAPASMDVRLPVARR